MQPRSRIFADPGHMMAKKKIFVELVRINELAFERLFESFLTTWIGNINKDFLLIIQEN